MYIPDMTERFPEGMNGVDMTDSYFPEVGGVVRDEEDYMSYEDMEDIPLTEEDIKEMDAYELKLVMQEFSVDEPTAKLIRKVNLDRENALRDLETQYRESIERIMEENGYPEYFDIPF